MKASSVRLGLWRAAAVLLLAAFICGLRVVANAKHGQAGAGEALLLFLLGLVLALAGVAALVLALVMRPPAPPVPPKLTAPGAGADGS